MAFDRVVLDGDLSLQLQMDGEMGVILKINDPLPYYTGPTEVTPTQLTQVLQTANKSLADNITVNPIPHNYGLITFDGSVLTVS